MSKLNLETVLAGCLALACLIFAPVARPQNEAKIASMDARSSFATTVENQLRQRGIDARVQLDGDRRDVLSLEWAGAHRTDVFGFVTSRATAEAQQLGFSTIVLANGQQRWTYDIARQAMVWSPAL